MFEAEAKKSVRLIILFKVQFIRTLSKAVRGDAAVIKSHHNVGGLPEHVDFKEIVEPLRDLFKDEVRQRYRTWFA